MAVINDNNPNIKIVYANKDFHTYEFVVESAADLENISKNVEGSFALDSSTGDVYVFSPLGEWKKI